MHIKVISITPFRGNLTCFRPITNYIEANESLSKKDFIMRIKICRKEAKESRYWLRLIDTYSESELERKRKELTQEAAELTAILGSILQKSE